jgi:glutamyl endopeptidase
MHSLKEFVQSFPLPEKKLKAFCRDPLNYLLESGVTLEGLPKKVSALPVDKVRNISDHSDLLGLIVLNAVEVAGNGPLDEDSSLNARSKSPVEDEFKPKEVTKLGFRGALGESEIPSPLSLKDKEVSPKAVAVEAYEDVQARVALFPAPAIFLRTGSEPFESFTPEAMEESGKAIVSQAGLPFPEFRQAFEKRQAQRSVSLPLAESSGPTNKLLLPAEEPLLDAAAAIGMQTKLKRIIGGPNSDNQTSIQEAIIMADDRVKIEDTTVFPFRWLCRLEITSATGARWLGTGWFISPSVIVTAGHCVFIHNHGGWVKQIVVHVAQNGTYSSKSLVSDQFATTRGWAEGRGTVNDYGAIFVQAGDQGFFGYGVFGDSILANALANVSGYPQDKPPGTLWGHVKGLLPPQALSLKYDIDTFGGMSGAPVVLWDGRDYVAVGIHNYGDLESNTATRITAEVFHNFERWKRIGSAA